MFEFVYGINRYGVTLQGVPTTFTNQNKRIGHTHLIRP